MVKDHVKQRQREWRKLGHAVEAVSESGGANVEGWQELRRLFEGSGVPVQRGGESLVTH